MRNEDLLPGKPRRDLCGMVFGWLTVTEFVGVVETGKSKGRHGVWRCRCKCGDSVLVRTGQLNTGDTKSCGCYKLHRLKTEFVPPLRKPKGEAAKSGFLRTYQKSAELRRIPWSLSDEEFHGISSQPCFYCGQAPRERKTQKQYHGTHVANGIDRCEPKAPYELSNCVACCSDCNYAKGDMTRDEFRTWVERISCHWLGGSE